MTPDSLLDTDTRSEVIKGRNRLILIRAGHYLAQHGRFSFSLVTRFEILRGLKARTATSQLAAFEAQCQASDIIPITDEVIVRAADLYADLHRRGQLIGDADLLIAATALVHSRVLVTNNTAHFSRIPGLILDCWAAP